MVGLGAEGGHRVLERAWSSIGIEPEHLTVEDDRLDRQRPSNGDHVGKAIGDVVQVAGQDSHLVAGPVHLHPGAIELPLDRGHPDVGDRLARTGGGGGQHRLDPAQHLQPDSGQSLVPIRSERQFGCR
ncbi:MAG: hypothetical protein R2710_21390 [Acidimicrobiales bacterium]